MKLLLIEKFKELYGREDGTSYFSPARVNLIGEYTDFNGGYVFPCGLAFGTYGIIGLRDDMIVRVYSDSFSKEPYVFELETFYRNEKAPWSDYIKGVIAGFYQKNFMLDKGFDLYIYGNMPTGAGLSSSASLEMLIAVMINDLFNYGIEKTDLALIGQYAENEYVGLNSGIMDQFAVVHAKKDQALLLNTDTLEFEQIPFVLNEYQLMVINTNKSRGLTESKYNERFNECMTALNILKPLYQINHLCELKTKELTSVEKLLDPIIFRRVRHVVTEQERTLLSSKALKENNIELFAKQMIGSHESLRKDFEVTGKALDTLVEVSLKAGALGARMTGAGFGGCIVAIIDKKILKRFIEETEKNYESIMGFKPTFYTVKAEQGTHKI